MEEILGLALAIGLGLIPANIAKKKGHSFGLWWFYGAALFIVAIIHVQFIEDYNASSESIVKALPIGASAADEIKKYKELLDQGIINEEEFKKKKEQLLK